MKKSVVTPWGIIIPVISLLVSTIYSLLIYFKGAEGKGITALSFGIVISLLLICMGLLYNSLTYLRELQGTVSDNSLLDDRAQKAAKITEIERLLKGTREKLRDIAHDSSKIVGIERLLEAGQEGLSKHARLQQVPQLIREAGERTLDDYIKRFSVTDFGFKVDGETWALLSYKFFWERLLRAQQERTAGNEDRLVVRITHSNSIDIWGRDIPQVHDLLKVQKAFCEAGGEIARLFLGNEPEQNKDYELVISMMHDFDIKAFYLYVPKNPMDYDFLWVSGPDFVVKWNSGAGGSLLSSCEISKAHENEVNYLKSQWASLWRQISAKKASFGDYLTDEIIATFRVD